MTFQKGNKKGKMPETVKEAEGQANVETKAPAAQAEAPQAAPAEVNDGIKFASTNKPLSQVLGEMFYYDENMADIPFETLPADERGKYDLRGRRVLAAIDKLNLMVVPRRDMIAEILGNKSRVSTIITVFLMNMNAPKDLHKVIPIDELAHRIVEGRIK